MKKLILILVFLLLLVGGGGAAYFFYLKDIINPPPEDEAAEEVPEAPAGPPVYVEFSPMQVPLLGERGVEQMLTLVVALQVRDNGVGDQVIEMAPRLNDAFLIALYGSLDSGVVMGENGMVDLRGIKEKLLEAAKSVLGEDVIQEILVQMISQRRV